ncbi:hypothetical protein SAMN05216312_102216 [Cohnella sp. OV330]|uniref:phage tail sheath family protein n=1 Tax=Cohnella sp. OV330 TaxID=1855288 RepID=UPI0008E88745|nr:phage tail protein [Cohnella sp. OV330]SFA91568.1 hypothetical protein SAMN05216312_102216 [Cohnella sp. OV330]
MSDNHGIYTSELKTSVLSNASQTIPVIIGTAPIHLSQLSAAPVNKPIYVESYEDAVRQLGYSDDWASYTLSEYIFAHFKLYKVSKAIFINVLDPTIHKTTVAPANLAVTSGAVTLSDAGVLKAGVTVKSADGATPYTLGTDYSLGYDSSGKLVITARAGGTIPSGVSQLKIGYDKLNPAAVNISDIIGGVDSQTGKQSGLELVNQVFPRFGVVPSLIVAPGYSSNPTVAAVMAAKSGSINGMFKAQAIVDLDVSNITQYLDAPGWKTSNNYTSEFQAVGYPNLTKDGRTFRFSSHLAPAICRTDTANDGIPYVSVSNQNLDIDGALGKDGAEFFLGRDQAAYLNSKGIVTAFNFAGWVAWGNRTGAYPANTDPKDAILPIRRMFSWVQNQAIVRYWSRVDGPLTVRLVESITDDINIWLNGLTAGGALVGGRIEFNAAENPAADLLDGKMVFHIFFTPPGPAQEISFKVEYDPSYLSTIYA